MDKPEVVARQKEELEVAIFNINARDIGKWVIKIDGRRYWHWGSFLSFWRLLKIIEHV